MNSFRVVFRDAGHWDVFVDGYNDRVFRVRGAPTKYKVIDERENKPNFEAKTLQSCMNHIFEELMFQLIATKSQSMLKEIKLVEDWNLS